MSYKFTTEDRQAIVETATRLGIDPGDLTAVMAYETIGSMNPDRIGGAKNAYRGLIQFGPTERKQFGYQPGMSIAEQVRGPVARYLVARGLKPGMGIAHLYSIINAGSLDKKGEPRWNAGDKNGTVRYHVGEIKRRYFGSGKPVGGLTPPLNVGQTAQGRQMSLGRGRGQISSGPAVRQLQQRLTDAGFDIGKHGVDGVYGKDTEAAVRAVEKKYGLTQERPGRGAAGPQVQAALAGNERMRIIADTQARFGDPLAPGGFPSIPGSPPPMGIGRNSPVVSPVPVAQNPALVMPRPQGPLMTAPPDPNAPPLVPPPQAVAAPHSLGPYITGAPGRTGLPVRDVAGGPPQTLPTPAPDAQPKSSALSAALASIRESHARTRDIYNDPEAADMAAKAAVENARWRGSHASDPNAGGMAPISQGGINNLGDIVDAWRRFGSDVTRAFTGGPPASSAAPAVNYPAPPSTAVVPPAVPASPSPLPFSGVQAGARIGVPQQSVGRSIVSADPSRQAAIDAAAAQSTPLSESDLAARNYGYAPGAARDSDMRYLAALGSGISVNKDQLYALHQPDPNFEDQRSVPYQPTRDAGGGFRGLPAVTLASPLPFSGVTADARIGVPQQQSSLGGSGSTDVLRGGAIEDYLQAPVAGAPPRATVVPAGSFAAAPWSSPSAAPAFAPAGDPANPAVIAAGDDLIGAGGLYGVNADPSRLAPGTLDTTATGGVPVRAQGVPYATDPMRRTAGFANIGNGVMQTPAPRPSLGAQVARYAVPAAVGMVGGPAMSLLAGVIARSASRGSLDNAQPYRGTTGGNYATLMTSGGVPALTQWGTRQYSGPSGISNSPFTPSGYTAPSFDPISGGPSYAYNPETHTYVDSQGRTHSYD